MTIGQKLSSISTIKDNIAIAITEKGVDVTGLEFSAYPNKIREISASGGGGGSVSLQNLYKGTWTQQGFNDLWDKLVSERNINHIVPDETALSQASYMYGSYIVFKNSSNGCYIKVLGSAMVDWGDGTTSTQDVADADTENVFTKNFTYSGAGTGYNDHEFRMITVTPRQGHGLKNILLAKDTGNDPQWMGWVGLWIKCPTLEYLSITGAILGLDREPGYLEEVHIYDNAIVNMDSLLKRLPSLRIAEVDGTYAESSLHMAAESSIQAAKFNLPNCTDFSNCFYSCHSLLATDTMNMSKVEYSAYMFYGCRSYLAFHDEPLFASESISLVGADSMFYASGILKTPSLDYTKFSVVSNMYNSCERLETFTGTNLDLSACDTYQNIFMYCYNLKNFPQTILLREDNPTSGNGGYFYGSRKMRGSVDIDFNGDAVGWDAPFGKNEGLTELIVRNHAFTDPEKAMVFTCANLRRLKIYNSYPFSLISCPQIDAATINEFFTDMLPYPGSGGNVIALYGVYAVTDQLGQVDFSIATAKGYTVAF